MIIQNGAYRSTTLPVRPPGPSNSISLASRSSCLPSVDRPLITEQVKSYRQRMDPNSQHSSSFTHGTHFNTINTLHTTFSSSSKVYTKQLSLFFHKKRTSTAS